MPKDDGSWRTIGFIAASPGWSVIYSGGGSRISRPLVGWLLQEFRKDGKDGTYRPSANLPDTRVVAADIEVGELISVDVIGNFECVVGPDEYYKGFPAGLNDAKK